MKSLFKQLITDFSQRILPHPTRRDILLPQLPANVRKAYVFTGMRRSGKTWALFDRMDYIIHEEKAEREKILYINFEDNRLEGLTGAHLE